MKEDGLEISTGKIVGKDKLPEIDIGRLIFKSFVMYLTLKITDL